MDRRRPSGQRLQGSQTADDEDDEDDSGGGDDDDDDASGDRKRGVPLIPHGLAPDFSPIVPSC